MQISSYQSLLLGSQLLMFAYSLFFYGMYRSRALLFFAILTLLPSIQLLTNLDNGWPPFSNSTQGLRFAMIAIGHAVGILYFLAVFPREDRRPLTKKLYNVLFALQIVLIPICLLSLSKPIVITEFVLCVLVYGTVCNDLFGMSRLRTSVSVLFTLGILGFSCAWLLAVYSFLSPQPLQGSFEIFHIASVWFGYFFLSTCSLIQAHDLRGRIEEDRLLTEHRTSLAVLGEMASSIAHEIKNPLAAIIYANELQKVYLAKIPPNLEKTSEMNEKISSISDQIRVIIESLHALSRNAEQDPFRVCSVNEILKKTADLIALRLKYANTSFSIAKISNEVVLECREIQICQVLVNLLNNSIDAVEKSPNSWVRLDVEDLGDSIKFSVIDSGPGIPREERKKILQSFYTTKEMGKGTGLGLNISKRIVDQHRGQLGLNESFENTRFDVTLPKFSPTG